MKRVALSWEGGRQSGRMLDVSAGGAQVVVEDALSLGQPIRVRFELPLSKSAVILDAAVVRQGLVGAGFVYGLKFAEVPGCVRAELIEFASVGFPASAAE